MNYKVVNAVIAFSFLGIVGALSFQNCAPVKVSQLPEAEPTAFKSDDKDCSQVSRRDGETWFVPNGTTRDLLQCQIGTGSQFQVFNEELQVRCQAGIVLPTGQTQRTPAQVEGLCNLDCGTHKNGETWFQFHQTVREPVMCTVGTGTQSRLFDEEKQYKCVNAAIVETGVTEKKDTGRLEGLCNLDCGTHKNLEKWWTPSGTSQQAIQCTVGTGTQYKILNNEVEYQCLNAVASPTGQNRQIDSGQIQGTCNLDCDTHKNAELWWMSLPDSTEIKKCTTSLTATSTIKYKNEAQYKCQNALTLATGETRQTVLSETECPPLTFNDKDNRATIAYEDILETNQTRDHDYNDFVANIKVLETYNSLEQLTKIQIEYTPKIDGGGYAAKLLLVFNGKVAGRGDFVSNLSSYVSQPMFAGTANIKYELFDANGVLKTSQSNVSKDQDLVIYQSTTEAVKNKYRAVVTVTNLDPELNVLSVRKGLSIQRYRSILFVKGCDTGKRWDIDLSDINPTMFDATKYPLAFFVPENWRPPAGATSIFGPYPRFKDHAEHLYLRPNEPESLESKNWFNYLVDPSKTYSQDGDTMNDSCTH